MTSWASKIMSRPPKALVQVEKGGISMSSHVRVPPKEINSFFIV
jgi:hypothetical protein